MMLSRNGHEASRPRSPASLVCAMPMSAVIVPSEPLDKSIGLYPACAAVNVGISHDRQMHGLSATQQDAHDATVNTEYAVKQNVEVYRQ